MAVRTLVSKMRTFIAGMTLLEIMIATVILAIVMFSALSVFQSSQSAVNTGYVKAIVEDEARYVLERLVRELRTARRSSDSAILDVQDHYVSFQRIVEYGTKNGEDPIQSQEIEYRLENDPSEILGDGKDNNSNGQIDETNSVLIREENGISTILTRKVESIGGVGQVWFELINEKKIKIRMTLIDDDAEKRQWNKSKKKYIPIMHRATVETEVYLRTTE